ncbi:class F sortase [Streptomyces sp. 6-11-2]|uniref:class F sortase n=1 Tax=Streptomyces sp. 6-11-2 TaxID=2585753 RepID=UPI00209C47DC|nr:class F sortase [Streptomyces sp. 6-11-2]
MASQQPPQTEQSGIKPARRRFRLRLLWPAAAVGLGIALIHNSLVAAPVAHPTHTNRPAAVTSLAPMSPEPSVDTGTRTGSTTGTRTGSTTDPRTGSTIDPRAGSTTDPRAGSTTDPGTHTRTGIKSGAKAGKSLPRSEPTRISIPKIGVDAPFTKLSVNASGQLNPPPANNTNLVGWFKGGPSPGERGASVVVGHLDTKTGPAVFAELDSLEPGAVVNITRADGTVARFKVDSIDAFSKAHFPDDRVYADTATPQLRLITCGGKFDRAKGGYQENVVVFAHLDSGSRR